MRARRCLTSRELLKHHQKCTNQSCPVCTPVKQYVQKQRLVMQKQAEIVREREARAAAYGGAGGQAMMQARLVLPKWPLGGAGSPHIGCSCRVRLLLMQAVLSGACLTR